MSFRKKSDTQSFEMQEVTWGLLEALMWEEEGGSKEDEIISIHHALGGDLDESAFGGLEGGSGSKGEYDYDVDIPHFPALSEAMLKDDQDTRTSEPIDKVDTQKEAEIVSFLDKKLFVNLLDKPMGLRRFQEWIEEEGLSSSQELLRLYLDTKSYNQLLSDVWALNKGIHSQYMAIRPNEGRRLLSVSPESTSPGSLSLKSTENALIDRLYADEFKRFIAGKISQGAKGRLGVAIEQDGRGDLAEVFCIADPRLPDQPLVLVSDAFCRLSEYPRSRLIGRNCRFLQGPQTDREAVRLLREAIEAGREHCTLLLNYTRTGKPFWNLLNMIPIRNGQGEVELLIGAQVNVSHALADTSLINRIAGEDQTRSPTVDFSPELLERMDRDFSGSVKSREQSSFTPNLSELSNHPKPSSLTPTSILSRIKPPLSRRHTSDPSMSSLDNPSIDSAVPQLVREQMVAFSSAYAKLLIFDGDRRISFVTPALLASLGYPIRANKDRWGSPLIGKDIIDLLSVKTNEETATIKSLIRTMIESSSSHSLFAGLSTTTKSSLLTGEEKTEDGTGFIRCLLHFTPLRNGMDVAEKYAVVVG